MEQFHHAALEIIRKTRDISLPQFGSAVVLEYKSAEANDAVTETDTEVEQYLKRELGSLDHEIGFKGEESGDSGSQKRHWLVDPIDGTGLYVRGMHGTTTIVALVENDQVTFGAIYDFVADTLFWAARGHGAFANDERLHVSDRSMHHDRVYIGYEIREDDPEGKAVQAKLLSVCGPVKYLSAGYEYALVASGKLDGRICSHPYGYDYDFAAGCLLVEEAGGVATNIGSREYRPSIRSHLVANPVFYKELTEGPDALFPVTE